MILYEYLKTIYEHILGGETGFNEGPYFFIKNHNFENLISDDNLCFELIKEIIDQDGHVQKDFSIFNRNRASHIVVTWLLGVGLAKLFCLNKNDSSFNNLYFYQIWLMSSIVHDYGYFKRELTSSSIDLKSLGKFNLLTNHYDEKFLECLNGIEINHEFKHYFSYTYDEINNYFEYSKYYHKNDGPNEYHEMCDHGIVGGCALFNEYCSKCVREINGGLNQSPSTTLIRKIACIIGASHNIYKSDSKQSDEKYKKFCLTNLLSISPPRVKKENNVLFLLSLVDTIECTKRFSQKTNPKEYLQQKTVLNKIEIFENEESISLDFGALYSYLKYERKNENMVKKLKNHISNIGNLGSWTEYSSESFLNSKKCRIGIKNKI